MGKIFIICMLLAAVFLAIDLVTPLGVADGTLYVAVVLLSLWGSNKWFTVLIATLCSILTVIGFFYSPPGGELWQVLSNRGLALFAIWVTAFLTLQRKRLEEERGQAVRRREKALEDVKVLRGFLPICASCKKIRDDQGYWNQIEHYIHEHSEADFSHSICPDCARRLYPEFYNTDNSMPNPAEEKKERPVPK